MSERWEGESVPLPKQMTSELAAFTLASIVAIVHDRILYRCLQWDPFEETRGNSGSWHVRSVHRFFSVTSIFLQRRSVDCRARARARLCACACVRVFVCACTSSWSPCQRAGTCTCSCLNLITENGSRKKSEKQNERVNRRTLRIVNYSRIDLRRRIIGNRFSGFCFHGVAGLFTLCFPPLFL